MRFRCYEHGRDETDTYDKGPDESLSDLAECYVEEHHDESTDCVEVIVEPADDEARAWSPESWVDDGDGPPFRMFVVAPTITFVATEVRTFNRRVPCPHCKPFADLWKHDWGATPLSLKCGKCGNTVSTSGA